MNPTRETIMEALKEFLADKLQDNTTTPTPEDKVVSVSRRLLLWSNAPKPSLFINEFHEQYTWQSSNLLKQSIRCMLFYYFDAGNDPNVVPATTLNTFLEALDVALAPDAVTDMFTIGGVVYYCRISGEVIKVTGDLDGEGMAVIPLEILVP